MMKTFSGKTKSTVYALPGAYPTYGRWGVGMPLPRLSRQRKQVSCKSSPVRRLAQGWAKADPSTSSR